MQTSGDVPEINVFTHCSANGGPQQASVALRSFEDVFGKVGHSSVWIDPALFPDRVGEYERELDGVFDSVNRSSGLADGYCRAVQQAQCRWVVMLEGDWLFIKENISHSLIEMLKTMDKCQIAHWRFNKRTNAPKAWDTWLRPYTGALVPHCLTPNKSNNPHIIDVSVYRWVLEQKWIDQSASGSRGVEECLFQSPIVAAIYGDLSHPATVKHVGTPRDERLAVAMIAKNEQDMIQTSLESVREADEIVVVDTGSTDNTCRIIRELGWPNIRLFEGEYKWNDHFAEARNFALSKVTMPWVLSIDADNVLQQDGIPVIRTMINRAERANCDAVRYTIRANGSNDHHVLPWIFRKDSCAWEFRVHNVLRFKRAFGDGSDIVVTAYYSPAHKKDPDRALRMLKKQLEEVPGDARTLYYLAREYWYRREYQTAATLFQDCISKSKWRAEVADSHLYKARCLWMLRKGNEARTECLRAIGLNPHFREAVLFMAEMSYEREAKAWRAMSQACDNSELIFVRG